MNSSVDSGPVLLTIDLGASGGKVSACTITDGQITVKELYRFDNEATRRGGQLIWDLAKLKAEIRAALKLAGEQFGTRKVYISIDTWGVDGGLYKDAKLLDTPLCYRDEGTLGVPEQAYELVPAKEIYAANGLQFMRFNTIFQWLAMVKNGSGLIQKADGWGFMPDILAKWLAASEENVTDYTIASTSGGLKAGSMDWDTELLSALGIPTEFLPRVVEPGYELGKLQQDLATFAGLKDATIILGAGHDTACAVGAVPAIDPDVTWAYGSAGTWNLVGVLREQACTTEAALAANITNEGGIAGDVRFLKNIAGFFPTQECRKAWNAAGGNRDGKAFSWQDLDRIARKASSAFALLIDPNDDTFSTPGDMTDRVIAFARKTRQPIPRGKGAIIRAFQESLCFATRYALERIAEVTGEPIEVFNMVGGGTQNRQVCQWTANALGLPVVAGPVEATTIGNALISGKVAGLITDFDAARKLVADSFQLAGYNPKDQEAWEEGYQHYLEILGRAAE